VAAVLLWSTVATAFKVALRYVDHVQLLVWSATTSLVVLLGVTAAQGKLAQIRRMSARDWAWSFIMGMLNPFAYYLVLFKAYALLPAQQAQPLNYTWPVVLVLLSIPVLRQRIGLRSVVALATSFAGVVVISTEGRLAALEVHSPLGVGLAVGSSVIWAAFWLMNMRDDRDAVVKLTCAFLFGTVAVVAAALAMGRLEVPDVRGGAAAVYVGLFEMGFTFVLWLRALRLSRTTAQVSILVYFSPFLSLVFIHHVLGERIMGSTLVGLALIVGGVVLQQSGERRKAKERASSG
jgi:drug/metabolite transporter (DMT)-like permease